MAFHSLIALLPVSAMYTLPSLSTAAPVGSFNPEETRVLTVLVDLIHSSTVLVSGWKSTRCLRPSRHAFRVVQPGHQGADRLRYGVPLLDGVVVGIGEVDVARAVHRHAIESVSPVETSVVTGLAAA